MVARALPDDRELAHLMVLAQAGDRAAYARVLAGCVDILSGLRACESPRVPCDQAFVETCLLAIHAARHTFDPKRSFLLWVAAIARHHGLSPS